MIWVLLSAGRGPGECKIAAKGLLRELLAEASGVKVEASVIDLEEASYGLMSALVSLEEDDADALARSWEGTVKLVCPSPFRPGWGRKNWFIGVSGFHRHRPPKPCARVIFGSTPCARQVRAVAARQQNGIGCPDPSPPERSPSPARSAASSGTGRWPSRGWRRPWPSGDGRRAGRSNVTDGPATMPWSGAIRSGSMKVRSSGVERRDRTIDRAGRRGRALGSCILCVVLC